MQFYFACIILLLTCLEWKASAKNVFQMSAESDRSNDRGQEEPRLGAVTFNFAKHFQSHMVLQKAPQRANIYGFSPTIGQKVTLQLTTVPATHPYNYETTVRQGQAAGVGEWNFLIDAFGPNVVVTIKVESGGVAHTISDVIFGDVWLCSGQSNMAFTVIQMIGGAQEIADAHNYPNIRLMTVHKTESFTPLYDLARVDQAWAKADNNSVGHPAWTYFSAVCWLFGKAIHKARHYPIGLVASDWGGTPVKAWSSPQALAHCGVHENNGDSHTEDYLEHLKDVSPEDRHRLEGPGNSSVLWNSMIHPLLGMTIYGAIWYQGESDSGVTARVKYNCTFPTMIKDWRSNFNKASNGQTSASFPFGFVQLAPNSPSPGSATGFTDIRWHQTADRGYVPNPDMANVFMAVALDLPDFNSTYGTVHPRYKKDIGDRLALSGLAVAYHQSGLYQGPLPSGSSISSSGLVVDYGNTWSLDIRVSDGFEIQCAHTHWVATNISTHTRTTITLNSNTACHTGEKITGLRYAWRESPCALHKCAVYETSKGLPAPPFVSLADYYTKGDPVFRFDRPHYI
ncbi:sialate O-acetylesterase-like [Physella acuta]|uniref:sialate O-acetylesterase-like n=1 Tax=Physella acuta TaxID=109671 RepID=UPI0027DBDCB3|nr:sialate O-acetylesterase-like [Physella acuta]